MRPVPVETDRLRLRDLEIEDADALTAAWSDPDVARFMDDFGPRTAEEVRSWLPQSIAANQATPSARGWSVVEKASERVIGWIGFGPSARGVADIDFAYVIAPEHRGRG